MDENVGDDGDCLGGGLGTVGGVVGMNAGAAHTSESEFESDVGLSGAIAAQFGDSVAVVPW